MPLVIQYSSLFHFSTCIFFERRKTTLLASSQAILSVDGGPQIHRFTFYLNIVFDSSRSSHHDHRGPSPSSSGPGGLIPDLRAE